MEQQITEIVHNHEEKMTTTKQEGTYKKGISINDFDNFETSMKYY